MSRGRPRRGYGSPMPHAEGLGDASAAGDAQIAGWREQRRREARDRLYDAAIALFLEQGYERTTMDEIANRADVARATVFNHYGRKSEFLVEWGARRRAKIARTLRHGHLNDKPIDVILESYLELLAELNLEHRAEAKELMPASVTNAITFRDPPLARTFANYIRHAQKRGQVRMDIESDQAGLMLAATYFSTLLRWCDEDPPPFDLGEALLSAARLMLHGVATSTPGGG